MKNTLPTAGTNVPRVLVLQFARLGDLVQTLPVLTALKAYHSNVEIDLLCPEPLVPLAMMFPCVAQVLPWPAEAWHALARARDGEISKVLGRAERLLTRYPDAPYSVAYNLNNHPRAVLAAHLLSERVYGVGSRGPLVDDPDPWMRYLHYIARKRGQNPIHLIDAWCGLCGVAPPGHVPRIPEVPVALPRDLRQFTTSDALRVALIIGAGDANRRIPLAVWKVWITTLLARNEHARVVVLGSRGERALGVSLLDGLSSDCLGRVWDACGRIGLAELVAVLSRCHWVVGADTGPLHVGAACGARAMGWYVSRARVHETGPYGVGHWIWQAEPIEACERSDRCDSVETRPDTWPIAESVDLVLGQTCSVPPSGWSLWESRHDEWGAWYENSVTGETFRDRRRDIWAHLNGVSEVDWRSMHQLIGDRDPAAARNMHRDEHSHSRISYSQVGV
ncbi:MAG: hypothetical protein D6690_07045 [Nitrospirae bacterium]|nr:MAG: hypothetical protein D6690_07045 [Nitrospirota bacterium]